MMRWRVKTETTSIGNMELENVMLNEDCLDVSIDILDMSGELKAEVDKAIEAEKVRYSMEWDEILSEYDSYKRFSTKWSDRPVAIDFNYLLIKLEAGKPITYTINTGFHDVENDRLEPVVQLNVDLSAYEDEIKKAIIHVMIENFF